MPMYNEEETIGSVVFQTLAHVDAVTVSMTDRQILVRELPAVWCER